MMEEWITRKSPEYRELQEKALAALAEEKLSPEYIIPSPFDGRVAPAVAKAVAEQAKKEGLARV